MISKMIGMLYSQSLIIPCQLGVGPLGRLTAALGPSREPMGLVGVHGPGQTGASQTASNWNCRAYIPETAQVSIHQSPWSKLLDAKDTKSSTPWGQACVGSLKTAVLNAYSQGYHPHCSMLKI